MKSCPQCAQKYSDDVVFCSADGTALIAAAPQDDALIGKTIGGKFLIMERLGSGGMGRVYKAEHVLLKHTIALKILHGHLAMDDEYLARFQREARTACRITHPNAITLHDFGVDGDYPYLAMEYIEGESLSKLIAREAPLSIDTIYSVITQIAEALGEAHSLGIVHRDLKPENIMVSRRKDGAIWVKVVDFGIAKLLRREGDSDALLTKIGTIFGSPRYMAPEQALEKEIDARADLYSLGVMLYELLTKKVPLHASSVMEAMVKLVSVDLPPVKDVNPELTISDAQNSVVMKLLEREPDKRYASVDEFLIDFKEAFGSTFRTTHLTPEKTPLFDGKFYALTGLILAVAIIAGASFMSHPSPTDQKTKQLEAELRSLEALRQQKEEEIRRAAQTAELKKQEALKAAQEAEQQREEAARALKEIEQLQATRAEEEEKAASMQEEIRRTAALVKEQREVAKKAAAEAETHRLEREKEEQRALALRKEAEAVAALAEEEKRKALNAAVEASTQRAAVEEEKLRAAKLQTEAEEAAKRADKLKVEIEKAEARKQAAEKAAKEAEKSHQAKVASEAKSSQQITSPAKATPSEETVAAMKTRIAEEAKARKEAEAAKAALQRKLEAQRQAALEKAKIAEEQRLRAEKEAKLAAQEAAEKEEELEEQSDKLRSLPRQGKRR